MNYALKFLKSLEPDGMQPHCVNLKFGSLDLLLRNNLPPSRV